MSFANEVRARLPKGMHLPAPFAQTFDWLEAQGWDVSHDRPKDDPFTARSLLIYPLSEQMNPDASYVTFSFEPAPPIHAPPPEVTERLVTIGVIAGDGGTLSLWLDDAGKQWIAVFNHGNPYVLTDDPLVALQFLALGYPEPAALQDPTLTPSEVAERDLCDPPLLPQAFRGFLHDTFGVTLPPRASDLGITIPPFDAPDPLRDWLDIHAPVPDLPPELTFDLDNMPGQTPENPYIVTKEFREIVGDDGVEALRSIYKFMIEEE